MLTTFDAGDGRTLSYSRRGSGPLVVCVPGGPGFDPEAYLAPLELPGFELLILAPRGTGDSSAPASDDGYRIAGYVEDLESLRVHLGVERLTIYGHSHGGSVALAYARAEPGRVDRMLLSTAPAAMGAAYRAAVVDMRRRFAEVAPDGPQRLAAASAAAEALEGDLSEDEKRRCLRTMLATYVVHEGSAETAYLDGLSAAPMNWDASPVMFAEMLDGLDLLEGADAVRAPALVIAGELDVILPPTEARRIADALPNARCLEFPATGHFVEVEAPRASTEGICAFLAE